MLPENYYHSVNQDLLRLIPPDCATVLEIGCGEGALCEAYRRVNPGVEWRAVELNEAAAKIAQSKGIVVVEDDIECFDYLDNAWEYINNQDLCDDNAGIDCLIFGDVLEHLRDPWKILKELAELVRPGAQVLACIPNVQHWSIIRDLLAGKWEYADSGLMDRTHLRFFTLDSIRKLFDDAGLMRFEILGRDLFNEGFEDWVTESGVKTTKEMRAYQYIVRAIKPPFSKRDATINGGHEIEVVQVVPPKLHLHAITAELCCVKPRVLDPFAALRTVPGITCTIGIVPGVEHDNKILIRQRNVRIEPEHLVQFIDDGWLIVQDCDDYPDAYQNGRETDWRVFRACHAIQCSTDAIAEIVRKYNPNVMVFPNQLAELPPWKDREPRDDVHIFFGAQNRESDWAPIMPALNRVIMLHNHRLWFSVVHDRAFYDALDTMHKSFTPFCEYEKYMGLLGACDIALLPLEDTPFNRCKSDIKFLECASVGTAAIASPLYRHAIGGDDCVARGLWYLHPDQFANQLGTLIANTPLRSTLAERAYAYVRDNRLLGQHYRTRLAWYRELLTQKQALHADLLRRVPELIAHPVIA